MLPSTIQAILDKEEYRVAFRKFCVNALASENMEFFEAAEAYEKLEDAGLREQVYIALTTYILFHLYFLRLKNLLLIAPLKDAPHIQPLTLYREPRRSEKSS